MALVASDWRFKMKHSEPATPDEPVTRELNPPLSLRTVRAAKRALRREMLFHVWVGHPMASALSALGAHGLASRIHYATLPWRVRRRLGPTEVRFDRSSLAMLWHDAVVVPICTTLRGFDLHVPADWIADHWAPQVAKACGACQSSNIQRVWYKGYLVDPGARCRCPPEPGLTETWRKGVNNSEIVTRCKRCGAISSTYIGFG